MPQVSVVLPVYNAQAYVGEALDSILQQTLVDFELILIDDGSTDASREIIRNYETRDRRIRAFRQDNHGLPFALNRGIQQATGRFVARMDADDICKPTRLQKQAEFLEAHPDCGLCGTWVEIIGWHAGDVWRYPVDDDSIRSQLVFSPALAHPAVMMRRQMLLEAGGYSLDWPVAEDYELWVRLADRTRVANLPEALLCHRLHEHQKGEQETGTGAMAAALQRVQRIYLDRLQVGYDAGELEIHAAVGRSDWQPTREFVRRVRDWFEKLLAANRCRPVFPQAAFGSLLANRWWGTCYAARSLGIWTWLQFTQSRVGRAQSIPKRTRARFALACLQNQLKLRPS